MNMYKGAKEADALQGPQQKMDIRQHLMCMGVTELRTQLPFTLLIGLRSPLLLPL